MQILVYLGFGLLCSRFLALALPFDVVNFLVYERHLYLIHSKEAKITLLFDDAVKKSFTKLEGFSKTWQHPINPT